MLTTSDCIDPRGIEVRLEGAISRQMERSLCRADIALLREATRVRSAGLALARAGQPGDREKLTLARRMLTGGELGEEARTFGLSFQEPAEAYLLYKAGDHDAASAGLRVTWDLLTILADRYDHDVVVRRGHIGRNLLVTLRLAQRYEVAGPMAAALVVWVMGWADWPFGAAGRGPGRADLPDDEREVVTDQIVAELGRLALASPSSVDLRGLLALDHPSEPTWQRVRSFLHLVMAQIDGDDASAAAASDRYARLGCGRLWQMRRMAAKFSTDRPPHALETGRSRPAA